jgi:hypothetical protein
MSERWIRASELADYVYCRRAWWLRRVQGFASDNVRELTSGAHYHQQHGQVVRRAIWARRLAYLLIFITVAYLTFTFLI